MRQSFEASADFGAQSVAQLLGDLLDAALVGPLDHHPHLVFGSGVADEDPSRIAEVVLGAPEGLLVSRKRLQRGLRADRLIEKDLRLGIEGVKG